MQDVVPDYQEDIRNLNSEDPTIRKETVERYYSEELPDEVAQLLCTKIHDEDKGVRDSVGFVLALCTNNNVPFYLVPFVSSSNIAARNLAGEILLKRGSSSINAMLNYLDKGDDDDKKFIVDVLGLITDPAVSEKILELLKVTENDNVKLACIEALGNLNSIESLSEITKFYDLYELFRPTVIEAVGKIGEQKSLEFIMEKYKSADDLTKFSMLEILGRIGDETTFFFLLSELRSISAPLTWAAVTSIKNLKEKLNLDIPYDESTRNSVLNTLYHGELEYQRAASSLLTFFKDKEILAACFQVYGLDYEIDENIKTNFFENKKGFFSEIINYLKPNSSNLKQLIDLVRQMVEMDGEDIKQLSQLGLHNFCSSLTDLFSHPDEEVRRMSMELIFSLDQPSGFIFIDLLSSDNNVWNRMRLIDILENIFTEESNKALINLMKDEEEMVRERASSAINQRRILN